MPLPDRHPPARDPASPEPVRPGALSALLVELVGAPDAALGSAWDEQLRAGTVIGRFELVRELGRGGFGVVWEARDRTLGRAVAFKAVRTEGGIAAREERLLREAEAAARLSHPNIVTLYDAGRAEQGPYLVLELLRGRTLAERLRQGPLPVREAIRVGCEVARGLAHAHAQGVIHRDLTPGNVFLCEDGQVKILDFGMAHAFGRRKLEGGTPDFMAPEQWRGAPEDERTDVFALGVVLYRMLAGEPPFPADGGRSVQGSRPAPALEVPEQPAVGALVGRMLALDPVERPRDAAAVLAELAPLESELARTPSSPGSGGVRTHRRARWRVPAMIAAGVVLGAAIATGLVLRQQAARTARGAAPSVAVLPFADMSPQKDQEYFSDGLSEEILNALAQVDGLAVTGRTSSFSFKGKGDDLRTIGEKLNVGAVLEGSVRKVGNRVRITAQLVKLPDGFHLWSETFDRELTDVFAVQDEIARAVAQALSVKLLPRPAPGRREAQPASPEAHAQYLLARQFYARYTQPDFQRAVTAYEKAIALDPGYAAAWAGLAVPLFYTAMDEKDPAKAAAVRERAFAAAERAVALDPQLAEGYSGRGYLRGVLRREWREARADMERALALAPSDGTTLRRYGILKMMHRRPLEALEPLRRAVEVDPLFPSNWLALGSCYAALDRLPDARTAVLRALEIAPEYGGLPHVLGTIALRLGELDAARGWFDRVKDPADRLMGVAMLEHRLGHVREAREALEALAARYGAEKPELVAAVHAFRGEKEEAIALLERAAARAYPVVPEVPLDGLLDRELSGDPRYEALRRKVGLPGD